MKVISYVCRRGHQWITMPINTHRHLLFELVIFLLSWQQQRCQKTCREASTVGMETPWRMSAMNFSVQWRIDEVCSTSLECYGYMNGSNTSYVQLCPLEVQDGDRVFIEAPPEGSPYDLHIAVVSYEDWVLCPHNDSTYDAIPMIDSSENVEIPSAYLTPGNHYLSQLPNGAFSNCDYGLRLEITVKSNNCFPESSSDPSAGIESGSQELCSGHGDCVSMVTDDAYTCACDVGYMGPYCEEYNACVTTPCLLGGTCTDVVGGIDGLGYVCSCPEEVTGSNCDIAVVECEGDLKDSFCENNGTCVPLTPTRCLCPPRFTGEHCETYQPFCIGTTPCRNNATCLEHEELLSFTCLCVEGYTGVLCEEDINECESNPCGPGTCHDDIDKYTCECLQDGRHYDQNCNVIPPCLSNFCVNNSTCVNTPDLLSYNCLCLLGYQGEFCDINIDECENITCHNGGSCLDMIGYAVCSCPIGFTDTFCEVNIDDCTYHECRNNGTCEDLVAGYACLCQAGFTGDVCEFQESDCSVNPCQNGGACEDITIATSKVDYPLVDDSGTLIEESLDVDFLCYCPVGYTGAVCETQIVFCDLGLCQNGGKCSDEFDAGTCLCPEGFIGDLCEENVDDCVDNECSNGAVCVDGISTYSCDCPAGFTGTFCQRQPNLPNFLYDIVRIDECDLEPCENGGQCVNLDPGFSCFCKNGYTGLRCEINYDECASSPCGYDASCIDGIASFTCQCPPGIAGVLCTENVDECRSQPCLNNALCLDYVNHYRCLCPLGFTGVNCEYDIDECDSRPCLNNGTCRDGRNSYVCDCSPPFLGQTCQLLPCDLNPCSFGGECVNDLEALPDGFVCHCPPGLTGKRCRVNIDDCYTEDGSDPCSDHGFCLDGINSRTCLCQPGWKGDACHEPVNGCSDNLCHNNATCVNLWNGYRCQCGSGYEGEFCEREIDECLSAPCNNGGSCVDLFDDFRCICTKGWTGQTCNTQVNDCSTFDPNPCQNGGSCVDILDDFTCVCLPSYTGRYCEQMYDPCDLDNNPCLHGAECLTNQDGSYKCVCSDGFSGINCEIDLDECGSRPCQNGAACEDLPAGFLCHCLEGFTGPTCDDIISNCDPQPCQNNATCRDFANGYVCDCDVGYEGVNCEQDINECESFDVPCYNNATCVNLIGTFLCRCLQGYTGDYCETEFDECSSQPCQNEAFCEDLVDGYVCHCVMGFDGPECQTDINECSTEPCIHGSCIDLVNNNTCECDAGWTGLNCSEDIDECVSSPCQHRAECIDYVDHYICACDGGYVGVNCEVDLEVCNQGNVTACQNGGSCEDGPGSQFICVCPAGFNGTLCEQNIDDCLSAPCANNGSCTDLVDSFSCACMEGWAGLTCEKDINECDSNPCLNNGLCQQMEPGQGFECLCLPGLGGPVCEINYKDCLPHPRCDNGGTCHDGLNNFTCECPEWAAGPTCADLLYTPTPTPTPPVSSVSVLTSYEYQTPQHPPTVLATSTIAYSPTSTPVSLDTPITQTITLYHTQTTTNTLIEPTPTPVLTESVIKLTTPVEIDASTTDVIPIQPTPTYTVIPTTPIRTVTTMTVDTEPTSTQIYPVKTVATATATQSVVVTDVISPTVEIMPTETPALPITTSVSPISTSAIIATESQLSSVIPEYTEMPTNEQGDSIMYTTILDTSLPPVTSTATVTMTVTDVYTQLPTIMPSETVLPLTETVSENSTMMSTVTMTMTMTVTPSVTPTVTPEYEYMSTVTPEYRSTMASPVTPEYLSTSTPAVTPEYLSTVTSGSPLVTSQTSAAVTSTDMQTFTSVTSQFSSVTPTFTSYSTSMPPLVISTAVTSAPVPSTSPVVVTPVIEVTPIEDVSGTMTTPETVTVLPRSCDGDPCQNGGSCMQSISALYGPGFICLCPLDFTGPTCETAIVTSVDPCDLQPCLNGGTCTELESLSYLGTAGYECTCPVRYTGDNCEIDLASEMSQFSGNSFLMFDEPRMKHSNMLVIHFKTTQVDGIILYAAMDYSEDTFTHFIQLYVENGILKYQFSCVIRGFDLDSNTVVNTGEIFTVTVRQTETCKATLTVDGPGTHSSLEMGMNFVFASLEMRSLSNIYLGGIPDGLNYIPGGMKLNFVGCISAFMWNGVSRGLDEALIVEAVDVCLEASIPTLVPITPDIPSLPNCQEVTCYNGGTCHDIVTVDGLPTFSCDCGLHFTGMLCEEEIVIYFPSFGGNSYLEHSTDDLDRTRNVYYLTFITTESEGTLVYAASSESFLHLFIEDSRLVLQTSCGSNNAIYLHSQTSVNSGNLTEVTIIQQLLNSAGACFVSAQVNDQTAVTSTLVSSQAPPTITYSTLYIGGTPPDIVHDTRSSDVVGFQGCVRHLLVNDDEKLLFYDAIGGQNIADCPVETCTYEPCLHGGSCHIDETGWFCVCQAGYVGALCERSVCTMNPCMHGGTCVHDDEMETYICLCAFGRHGVNCEEATSVSRPHFFGSQYGYSSYITYPRLVNVTSNIEIRFTFVIASDSSSTLESSLLIFMGQKSSQPNFGDDFMAVGVEDGYVVFRYNLGSGTAEIRSSNQLSDLHLAHRVHVGRNGRDGWLQLDDLPAISGSSPGRLIHLNTFSDLYVGGHDSYDLMLLPHGVQLRNGFEGCIYDLEVRAGQYGSWTSPSDIQSGRNVYLCDVSECEINFCRNGGTCVDLGASFSCQCSDGWKGRLCADAVTMCDSGEHDCAGDAICEARPEGGYRCHCQLGAVGQHCENSVTISDAYFAGEKSYLAFKPPLDLRYQIDIRLQIKPETSTGLVLYIAQHLNELTRDFLSVVLQDGSVVLYYRLGSDLVTMVTSSNNMTNSTDDWYTIEAGRNITHAYVSLDGVMVTQKATQLLTGLDVTTLLYLGGVPDLSLITSSAMQGDPSSFEGCIRELVVNGNSYDLSETGAVEGLDVSDCDGTSCGYNVCRNGGTCSLTLDQQYHCTCPQDYTGSTCELPIECTNHWCAEGSICWLFPGSFTHQCVCPLGKKGVFCEQDTEFSTARFSGYGYLRYIDLAYNDDNVTVTYTSFSFKTIQQDALIMWNGEVYSEKDDYLGVGVVNGRIVVYINLGWWTRGVVVTQDEVSDGFWHMLLLHRDGQNVTVNVDGHEYTVELQGEYSGLNTHGQYHFGGFEMAKNITTETLTYFFRPFEGCIADIQLYEDAQPISILEAEGMNVFSCDDQL